MTTTFTYDGAPMPLDYREAHTAHRYHTSNVTAWELLARLGMRPAWEGRIATRHVLAVCVVALGRRRLAKYQRERLQRLLRVANTAAVAGAEDIVFG